MKQLPPSPNLQYYKAQAKALVKAHKVGDADALQRIHAFHPRLSALDLEALPQAAFALSDAQWVIAREHGFPSWPKFKQHLAAITAAPTRHRPFVKEIQYYEDRAAGLLSVYQTGQAQTLQVIRRAHPRFATASDAEIRAADFTLDDARLVFAREHGFEQWADFMQHIGALQRGEVRERFMEAYEAVQAGDLPRLQQALDQDPKLVNAPGTNSNYLLTLATSSKRLEVVDFLLAHGADVNLANNRGWTPLHAAAYGNPHRDQTADLAVLKRLLAAGAAVEVMAHGEGGTPLMQALFWGNHPQADLLAEYGVIPNNLRAAAGLGRLDLIRAFFRADGTLTPEAGQQREFHRPHSGFPAWTPSDDPQEILDEALVYACKSGRVGVLDFLTSRGANLNSQPYNGTPLYWAAANGHIEVARWLLNHGADLHQRANFGRERNLTTLHIAAWAGQTAMAAFLVDQGADVMIRDDRYQGRPSGWAEHAGYQQTYAFLKQKETE